MTALPVEWVLTVFYGPSAHRATYGRLEGTQYTKDYIQLSRREEFIADIKLLFPVSSDGNGSVDLTYRWPTGAAGGKLIYHSADRPHLAWETRLGAPKAWRMSLAPSDTSAETIPGDPSLQTSDEAEQELALVSSRGAGQPYLMAIKLKGEHGVLHLRAYLKDPIEKYSWANLQLVPPEIQKLAASTSKSKALSWSMFQSSGILPNRNVINIINSLEDGSNYEKIIRGLNSNDILAVSNYLKNPGKGLFFDPFQNHESWFEPPVLSEKVASSAGVLLELLNARLLFSPQNAEIIESPEFSPQELEDFRNKIENKNYEVLDSYATSKTRGSAQRAFSEAVKRNYNNKCAVTGIATNAFLVASHIVPWSEDHRIRLDPSNGICLSVIMDRAFENGYLIILDDLTIVMDWEKVGDDIALRSQLEPYDGKKIICPTSGAPKAEYLERRRRTSVPD